MRIAVLADHFPELSQTFVSGEIRELARQGHHVVVVAGEPLTADPSWHGGVPIVRLDAAPRRRSLRALAVASVGARAPRATMRDRRGQARWRSHERIRGLGTLATVARSLRRHRIDHLHAHFAAGAALDAMRLSRLIGIPYSVTAHAFEIFQAPANLEEKLEHAAFVTVPCAYNVGRLRPRLSAAAGARIHVQDMGVDAQALRRSAALPERGLTLAVGRLVEKKGFRHLIEAAAQRDLGDVAIVGGGPLERELRALAVELGVADRVRFTGPLPPPEIKSWMERAALLVVPSVVAADGDMDALPVVIWEALALELPVVGSDLAGLPEVIRPPWGTLVPPGDSAALAEAIAALLDLPVEERRRRGRAGRAWLLAGHTREQSVRALVDLMVRAG
jgi:colanic acid/amylovoran biosynthesis glycosyltransferase